MWKHPYLFLSSLWSFGNFVQVCIWHLAPSGKRLYTERWDSGEIRMLIGEKFEPAAVVKYKVVLERMPLAWLLGTSFCLTRPATSLTDLKTKLSDG